MVSMQLTLLVCTVGLYHIYSVYTEFPAGRSLNERSYTGCIVYTVQTLYHRAKITFFALRGDCAHEKYLFIGGVRD
jgi:hypothetical protein